MAHRSLFCLSLIVLTAVLTIKIFASHAITAEVSLSPKSFCNKPVRLKQWSFRTSVQLHYLPSRQPRKSPLTLWCLSCFTNKIRIIRISMA